MNYYERHLGDYARDTAHLTLLEHGAYTLLLDRYYTTERPIPCDEAHRLARARTREERAAVSMVLHEFFRERDDHWHHKYADRVIEKTQTKIKAARENGKRGGRPKANPEDNPTPTNPKPTGFSMGSISETQKKALQTPDTRHQSPEKNTGESARGARLPPDWVLPEDLEAWARAKRPDLDPTVTASKFRDYWTAKPGAAGRKLDWAATWRNWVREERSGAPLRVVTGSEPAWRTEQRARMADFAGPAAAKPANATKEIVDVPARIVG